MSGADGDQDSRKQRSHCYDASQVPSASCSCVRFTEIDFTLGQRFRAGRMRVYKMPSDAREIGDFLIARGGPFYELQQRLGLLRENAFRAAPRAVLFVFLAWAGPWQPISDSLVAPQGVKEKVTDSFYGAEQTETDASPVTSPSP